MVTVRLTEDEAEQAILAMEYFRRHHLAEYEDEEDRKEVAALCASVERKLRQA